MCIHTRTLHYCILGIDCCRDSLRGCMTRVSPSPAPFLRHSFTKWTPVNKTMTDLGVTVLLGQRLDLRTTLPENAEYNERGERIVRTVSGRVVAADLIVCRSFCCHSAFIDGSLCSFCVPANVRIQISFAGWRQTWWTKIRA